MEESEKVIDAPADVRDDISSEDEISEEKLLHTLEIIQSSSLRTKEIYKALVFVRTKVLTLPDGVELLQKVDAFKCFMKMLGNSNEDILNITISIMGNLCNHLIMDDKFREEMVKSKVTGRLVLILRKVTRLSIRKRICRFIGNLAQALVISKELHQAGASLALIQVLQEPEDGELHQLAIRALRWLWHVDRYRIEMLRAGVLKAVAQYLTSEDPLVEKAATRALAKFTDFSMFTHRSIPIADQITCYKEIVERIDQPVYPVLIWNLSYYDGARRELCKAGIVPAIVDRLHNGKINSYLISGLCRMCRESMIRACLRQLPNGFPTFLSLLSEEKTKHFYPEVLEAITQFNYDESSLMMMVKCGLIGILFDKLSEYTKAHCLGHTDAVGTDWLGSPVLSPASSWTPSPSPPPVSPPLPPDYSPRCLSPDSESEPAPPSQTERSSMEVGLDGCVLDTLMTLTYLKTPMRALASKSSINTLLNYLSGVSYPRCRSTFNKATRSLTAILGCKLYWNTLLDDESVLDIHAKLCRPSHQDCSECRRLCETGLSLFKELGKTAQSGLGEGEMTYRLTGVSSTARVTAALTIPHVIRQPSLLETLLYGHGGLATLLDTLSTRADEAVPAIHSLFATLDVKNPQSLTPVCGGCEIGSMRKESTVMLVVDDGTTVAANRDALSHACPVFEAMFRGGFVESTQSCVRLSDISAACLTHLTRILPEYCSCALPKDLTVLLEMISATDRFLLPELSSLVVGVVRDSVLGPASAPQIYRWGLRTGQQYATTSGLPSLVVSYLFTSDILPAFRLQAVTAILSSEDKDVFLSDLSSIIRSSLTHLKNTHRISMRPRDLCYVSYER